MEKMLIALVISILQVGAFAGNTSCEKNLNLVCRITYNYANGPSAHGPSATSDVHDIQPEPFDPADCVASLVFMTPVGKIVANYQDADHSLRSWVDFDGQEKLIITDAPISTALSAEATIPGNANTNFESLTFTCSLNSNN